MLANGMQGAPAHTNGCSKVAEYDRLKTFFGILASGDRSRYILAATMGPQKSVSAKENAGEIPDMTPREQVNTRPTRPERCVAEERKTPGGPTPTVDAKSEFTFKMTIRELYEFEEFRKMVEDVLRKSRETFRPLTGLEMRVAMRMGVVDRRDSTTNGSLRLKRPVKRRCVGRDKRLGTDSETLEWFYDTADASTEYLAAVNLRTRKVSGAPPDTPVTATSTPFPMVDGGSRTRLESNIRPSRKRPLTEGCLS